jgi:hypothetical protein
MMIADEVRHDARDDHDDADDLPEVHLHARLRGMKGASGSQPGSVTSSGSDGAVAVGWAIRRGVARAISIAVSTASSGTVRFTRVRAARLGLTSIQA